MKEYLHLQFKMTNRKLTDFGLHPIIGYSLALVGFIGLSIFLFFKTDFAAYIFIVVALSFAFKTSESNRNDFLQSIFIKREYLKVRMLENVVIALPFIAFLAYKQLYWFMLALTILVLLMALINFNKGLTFTIPTLFSKRPFEFTVGFRNTFYLFVFAYFLTFMSVTVGNFNLGIFALVLVFGVSLSFYSTPENEYFVWSFIDTPKAFLGKKIKAGLLHSSILAVPICIALGVFFPSDMYIVLIILVVGYIYLITIILAKYSAYPSEMNLPQSILIGMSVLFPPMLIGVIPFFYSQSIKRLNAFLT